MRLLLFALNRTAQRTSRLTKYVSVNTPVRLMSSRLGGLQQPLAGAAFRSSGRFTSKRFYSEGPPPVTRDYAFERISGVLSNCEKVEPSKITLDARLEEDLGLDSLDVVDALFYVEEEFTVQMADHEADEMKTVGDVVEWVVKQPDAF